MFVICAVITLVLLFFIYGYFEYSFRYWKIKGIPYDEPIVPYGNTKELGKTIHPAQFTKNLYDKYKPTGAKICGVYFFLRPWAILLDLDIVKKVLVKDFDNFNERGSYFMNAFNDIQNITKMLQHKNLALHTASIKKRFRLSSQNHRAYVDYIKCNRISQLVKLHKNVH